MASRTRRERRWLPVIVGLPVLAAILYAVGFGAYGFLVGADEYLSGTPKATACATPGSRFGWAYDAINYDRADDERLLAENPDPADCTSQGSEAGVEVVTTDNVRIAGWFIPAVAPAAGRPMVVIVHGGKSNKSGMLAYAPPFHDAYDIVVLDLRNSGRSSGTQSSGGVRERLDLQAMLDWLWAEKSPPAFLVVGNSNGAATTLAEAREDPRVKAVILDSMHASVERQVGNVIVTERGLPAWPAAWALVQGVSAKLGERLESVDPERTLADWDSRPILFTHGSADVIDRPEDSLEVNVAVRAENGATDEVHICDGAGHGEVVEVCADAWSGWVLAFASAAFRG